MLPPAYLRFFQRTMAHAMAAPAMRPTVSGSGTVRIAKQSVDKLNSARPTTNFSMRIDPPNLRGTAHPRTLRGSGGGPRACTKPEACQTMTCNQFRHLVHLWPVRPLKL